MLSTELNSNKADQRLDSNKVYEASLKVKRGFIGQALYLTWCVLGLGSLIALAWFDPVSPRLFHALASHGVAPWALSFIGMPIVMALRAVLMVESVGYVYHRFFQHVGFLTRQAQVIRRNQHFHWVHHMIIYPIGTEYVRDRKYIPSEKGVGLSWVVPGLIVAGLFALSNGFNISTAVFIFFLWAYAKLVVDEAHARFHVLNHSWAQSEYFHWLEDIHVLHHWDQRTNFTIVHPAMDYLFGTYLSPAKHREEIQVALADSKLTVSDLINWRYLLTEASPAEYAAFISAAKRHRRSVTKLGHLLTVLRDRLAVHAEDAQALDMQNKALELFKVIDKPVPEA